MRLKGWDSFAFFDRVRFSHQAFQDCIVQVILTGMGHSAVNKVLSELKEHPDLVITAGFCGALNPSLRIGDVVAQGNSHLGRPELMKSPFYCSPKVVCTAVEKAALWESTGCDAVEMESKFIMEYCDAEGISAVVIRSVSDTADADMPLDFNRLTRPNGKISILRLMWNILLHPMKIGGLITLGIHSGKAADSLAKAIFREIETQFVDSRDQK